MNEPAPYPSINSHDTSVETVSTESSQNEYNFEPVEGSNLTTVLLEASKILAVGKLLMLRYKDARLAREKLESRATLDTIWDDIEAVLPTDEIAREGFANLVTFQHGLKLKNGRRDVHDLLNNGLEVEYTVNAIHIPSTNFHEGCVSSEHGYTETIMINITERIVSMEKQMSVGGSKLLVEVKTTLSDGSVITEDCPVYDGGDGHYRTECTLIQANGNLTRHMVVEVEYPFYTGYHNYFLIGKNWNVGNNIPLRAVVVDQNFVFVQKNATHLSVNETSSSLRCGAHGTSQPLKFDRSWSELWVGRALIRRVPNKKMVDFIPLPQCNYTAADTTINGGLAKIVRRYESIKMIGASHMGHWFGMAKYIIPPSTNISYTRFHYLEILNYQMRMALDRNLTQAGTPKIARELYNIATDKPLFDIEQMKGNSLYIIQTGSHDISFHSNTATVVKLKEMLELIGQIADAYTNSVFVILSTATYGIIENRKEDTPNANLEQHRHFRKDTNSGLLAQYTHLWLRKHARKNIRYVDYQAVTNVFKYDCQYNTNHCGVVHAKKNPDPRSILSATHPLLDGQGPVEAFTMMMNLLRD
eukprot:CFRG6377T1